MIYWFRIPIDAYRTTCAGIIKVYRAQVGIIERHTRRDESN